MAYQSLLEERTKDMTWDEVDSLWRSMEKGLPYISAEARTPALEMIKELAAIALRKHDEELIHNG